MPDLSYGERYPRCYSSLKKWGLSPFMALRVLVDAKRGCPFSIDLILLTAGRKRHA
jgi:hypothetical protein